MCQETRVQTNSVVFQVNYFFILEKLLGTEEPGNNEVTNSHCTKVLEEAHAYQNDLDSSIQIKCWIHAAVPE